MGNTKCIYKFTSPSGKSYIGQTNNFRARFSSHASGNQCRAFSSAIKKYGIENFISEILEDGLSPDEANVREAFYISSLNTMYPTGYNLTSGGDSVVVSSDTRAKMSEKALKYYRVPENKAAYLAARRSKEFRENAAAKAKTAHENPQTKIKHKQAVKKALSSPENRARCAETTRRRMSDPEMRQKSSDRLKAVMSDPDKARKMVEARKKVMDTEESKRKLSESLKAAHLRPDVKARQILNVKLSWQNEETRSKRVAKLKEVFNSEEYKNKVKAIRQTPEHKQKVSAAQKARRERERLQRQASNSIGGTK